MTSLEQVANDLRATLHRCDLARAKVRECEAQLSRANDELNIRADELAAAKNAVLEAAAREEQS